MCEGLLFIWKILCKYCGPLPIVGWGPCAFMILLKFRKLNGECVARIEGEGVQRDLRVWSEVGECAGRFESVQRCSGVYAIFYSEFGQCAATFESVQQCCVVCSDRGWGVYREVWECAARFGSVCKSVQRLWRVCSEVRECAAMFRSVQQCLGVCSELWSVCSELWECSARLKKITKAYCPLTIGSGLSYPKLHCTSWVWLFSISAAYWKNSKAGLLKLFYK